MKAGFETFWEVLQYYPKDYTPFQTHLQHQKHVVVRGRVTKSYGGSHGFNMEVLVDPVCNPLLHPPADDPSLDSPDDPLQGLGASFQQEEEDQASCTDADDEDQADLSSDSDLDAASGLDEHGRSVITEEASTSALSHSSSSSSNASHASSSPDANPSFPSQSVASPQQYSEQQTLVVNKYFQGSRGAFGARNLANQYRVGSEVMVQGKVTVGTKPGQSSILTASSSAACSPFLLLLLLVGLFLLFLLTSASFISTFSCHSASFTFSSLPPAAAAVTLLLLLLFLFLFLLLFLFLFLLLLSRQYMLNEKAKQTCPLQAPG